MDDSVVRAIERWPNVPAVAGWLRLDQRGRWWVKNAATEAFERISNAQIVAFINRNYAHDDQGRFYFQNGPQRVYVGLDYLPYVYRIADHRHGLLAHTGAASGAPRALFLDDGGNFVIAAALGAGVILDRDLGAFVDQLVDPRGAPVDAESMGELAITGVMLHCYGNPVRFGRCTRVEAPLRFGFISAPAVTAI